MCGDAQKVYRGVWRCTEGCSEVHGGVFPALSDTIQHLEISLEMMK